MKKACLKCMLKFTFLLFLSEFKLGFSFVSGGFGVNFTFLASESSAIQSKKTCFSNKVESWVKSLLR